VGLSTQELKRYGRNLKMNFFNNFELSPKLDASLLKIKIGKLEQFGALRDTLAATVNVWVNHKFISFARGESHDMQVHAEPTFDCRY